MRCCANSAITSPLSQVASERSFGSTEPGSPQVSSIRRTPASVSSTTRCRRSMSVPRWSSFSCSRSRCERRSAERAPDSCFPPNVALISATSRSRSVSRGAACQLSSTRAWWRTTAASRRYSASGGSSAPGFSHTHSLSSRSPAGDATTTSSRARGSLRRTSHTPRPLAVVLPACHHSRSRVSSWGSKSPSDRPSCSVAFADGFRFVWVRANNKTVSSSNASVPPAVARDHSRAKSAQPSRAPFPRRRRTPVRSGRG